MIHRCRRTVKKNAEPDVLTQTVAQEVEQDILRLLGAQDFTRRVDFDAVESLIKSRALNFAASLLETFLDQDDSDHPSNHIPCDCGAPARYRGQHARTLTTAVGDITYHRAYYYCDDCTQGWFPKDQAMGLDSRALSPGVVRMIGQVAGRESFAQSHTLLHELASVRVSIKQVERTAERLGKDIRQYEVRQVEQESLPARTMYLGVDGTGVPMIRSETEGVKGKQPDGTSKTREMKVATVWSCDRCDEQGHARIDVSSVTHTAAIESAGTKDLAMHLAPFAQRMEREALRRGFYDANRQVVIGDGAKWIWACFTELFPTAIQILDLFHALEKIWDISKLVYGDDAEIGRQWAKNTCAALRTGEIEDVIDILHPLSVQGEKIKNALGYFERNHERMRYKTFREQGLCVSSAAVEAGCKNVIGTRLKRGGMHWSKDGANSIASLRSYIISNRFDDYWYAQPKTPHICEK